MLNLKHLSQSVLTSALMFNIYFALTVFVLAVILAEVIALITASTVLISQHANAKMLDSLSAFYCMLHEKIFSSLTTWVGKFNHVETNMFEQVHLRLRSNLMSKTERSWYLLLNVSYRLVMEPA